MGTAGFPDENIKFSKIFVGGTWRFWNLPAMMWKSSGLNWQIYCVDLKVYIPGWRKSAQEIEQPLNVKKTSQKSAFALRTANENQYTNHQVNNTIKNQTHPKTSQHTSMEWLHYMTVSLTVTKTRIATIVPQEKWKDLQLTSPGV